MESLQKRFEKFCEEQFKNSQTSGSKTITKEKGKRIIADCFVLTVGLSR